jgi:hypothetical protein
MSRESWVYPSNGGPAYKRGESGPDKAYGPTIIGDSPDFVSPIDRKVYSGRAGMREHCKIHDVVSNSELKGLPPLTATSDMRSRQERQADANNRRGHIINQVNKHYR